MAEVPAFFSSLVGGVVGAVAAVDVPAEGERHPRPAPGTDWSLCCEKLHESGRELEGFLQQLTFIVGKVALGLRVGVEHLRLSLLEGRAPSSCSLLDKADVEQGVDAGRQGAAFLLRGGRLALEALLEGAKVAATRSLIAVESSKEVVLRNIPHSQEKLAQVYNSFLRGYQTSGRSIGYGVTSYQPPPSAYAPAPAPAYGAAPPSEERSVFFW